MAFSAQSARKASVACTSSGRANRKPWPLSQCSSWSSESSLLLLDALGDRLDRERLAELHEGVDQRLALLVVLRAQDERPVDLQRVDGEPLQVSQRGVAGAEVVDRDPHAELP